MGNITSTASISTISAASIIVGFVSFIFTLATAIKIFFGNLRTLRFADTEVKDFLPNLKQALYEERAHLRLVRRRCRAQYEEAAFRVLAESIRHMLSEFKSLEAPFVESSKPFRADYSKRERHGNMNGRRNSNHFVETGPTVSSDDYFLLDYGAPNFSQKFAWLKRRGSFVTLSDRLSRVQTRRIARQQADLAVDTRYLVSTIGDLQDRLEGMEHRLSRVAGGRRGID